MKRPCFKPPKENAKGECRERADPEDVYLPRWVRRQHRRRQRLDDQSGPRGEGLGGGEGVGHQPDRRRQPHVPSLGRLLADRDRRILSPDQPDSKAVFSRQGPAILEAARAAADKPGALQPGAESWSQAYVASGDLAAEVARLKAQDGKPMYAYGGTSFARSLIAHGLVDQFDLAHIPVVLGQGLSIFTELTQPRRFTVVSSKAFPKGTVVQTYRFA